MITTDADVKKTALHLQKLWRQLGRTLPSCRGAWHREQLRVESGVGGGGPPLVRRSVSGNLPDMFIQRGGCGRVQGQCCLSSAHCHTRLFHLKCCASIKISHQLIISGQADRPGCRPRRGPADTNAGNSAKVQLMSGAECTLQPLSGSPQSAAWSWSDVNNDEDYCSCVCSL